MNERARREAAQNVLRVLAQHGIPSADAAALLAKVAGAMAYRAQQDATKRARLVSRLGQYITEGADELEKAGRNERSHHSTPHARRGAGSRVFRGLS